MCLNKVLLSSRYSVLDASVTKAGLLGWLSHLIISKYLHKIIKPHTPQNIKS